MMPTWLTRRGSFSPIGMDIGRRGARLVQLAQGARPQRGAPAGGWRIFKTFCWEETPGQTSGTLNTRDTTAPAGKVAAALSSEEGCRELGTRLKRFLRQNDFRGRELVVGLSSPQVELHPLELPVADEAGTAPDLRQAAHWELERLMSLPQGAVESDFWSLPLPQLEPGRKPKAERSGSHTPGQPTAIGVVAEKRLVSGVWRMAQAAGLVCRRLDTGLCALSRFGTWLRRATGVCAGVAGAGATQAEKEIWGLLDLGDHQARLVVCLEDVPVLVRGFDTGGNRWVRRISDALGLSYAAAEIHLRDHGIQAPVRGRTADAARGVRQGDPALPSTHLGSIIRNVLREELDLLCDELERSYRYVLQCYRDGRVSELILVGGGADVRNLDEHLKGRLGIEVRSATKRWENAGASAGTETAPPGDGGLGRYSLGTLACAIGLALPVEERR